MCLIVYIQNISVDSSTDDDDEDVNNWKKFLETQKQCGFLDELVNEARDSKKNVFLRCKRRNAFAMLELHDIIKRDDPELAEQYDFYLESDNAQYKTRPIMNLFVKRNDLYNIIMEDGSTQKCVYVMVKLLAKWRTTKI